LLGGAVLFAAACGMQAARGHPLYPKLGDGPGPERVATLHGPIQTVDGLDVSRKGQTFELLPGCHVVTLQRNIGEGSANGAWAANLPRLTVAFEMKPAHAYAISSDMGETSGPVSRVTIFAREKAPDGSMVRVPFARTEDDITNCRRWAEAQGFERS
jgi:hypothetical protein